MSLRSQILRGGGYLALRQGLSLGLSLGGVLLLTRIIGPEAYGLYAAALGIYTYLFNLSQWGIGVYLIRREGEVAVENYHQGFTLLLLLGTVGSLTAWLGLPVIEQWVRLDGFDAIATALFFGLAFDLLALVPRSRLERALDYRQVAIIELSGQITYYVVALSFAYQQFGAWSPVGGWWAQQVLLFCLLYRAGKYRPRFYWDWHLAKEMVSYGIGYSASIWVWQLRNLINPLIVGRYAGAEAVGFVALAIRLVEMLSFVKTATWRLSIAALARLQGDRNRLAAAITEGMRLQVLALGPFLVGFAILGAWVMPLLFGDRWLPVLQVYPFIALSYLTNAVFSLHSSVLYVLQRNWEVAIFHFVHIILFAGTTLLLLPRLGLVGYGWGEFVAILSYAVIHFYTVKEVKSPDYRLAGLWAIAFALALFGWQLGWFAGLGLFALALWPESWRVLGSYLKGLQKLRHG